MGTTACILRFGRLFCLLAAVCRLAPSLRAAPPEVPKASHGVLIRLEGPIMPGLDRYLYRKLDAAKAAGADLVIVEIESPGGLLEQSEEMSWRLQNLDWARTVAYVPREALSGAAIVALGCDDILMAPNASLGDAGPIVMGEYRLFEHAPEKVVSLLTKKLRVIAEAKGRPPALAEAMADRTLVVYEYRNSKTGEARYMSKREVEGLQDAKGWKQGPRVPESGGDDQPGSGRFLTLTGTRAVQLGLAEGIAKSRQEVAARYSLSDLQVIEPGGMDTIVDILNSPWITGLILVIGLVGLYVEFMSPGIGLGGVIAVVCFVLFFWSHILGGTAGWLGVLLFLAGIALLGVELFLLPGAAIPGILGAVLVLISLVMSQSSLIPKTPRELELLAYTLGTVFVSGVVFTTIVSVLGRRFGALPLFRHMMLAPPASGGEQSGEAPGASSDGFAPPPVQVGDLGIAHTALRPGGKGRFGEHFVDVLAYGDFINRGRRVRVAEVSGHQVFVTEVEDA